MSAKDLNTIQKIELLVSFLDEDNAEILKNIEAELFLLNEEENLILKQSVNDLENSVIANRVKNIIVLNHFRFFETELLFWLKSKNHNLFNLLTIIARIEYPELDCKSLKLYFDKMLKEIWTAIPPNISALDLIKLLKSIIYKVHDFKEIPYNLSNIKHLMINDVLIKKETNILFLNILYLSITRELGIPVVPLKINGLIILGFKNKPPYSINFLDNDFLFFIDNSSFEPYPEAKLKEKIKINSDEELTYISFTDLEIAIMLLKCLCALYEKEKNTMLSDKINGMIERIEEV
jgi:hypothetical protein